MLEILLRGVSTRQYRAVLPAIAETGGVSRPSVSPEAMGASDEELRRVCERRLDELDLLFIYLDGAIFGDNHVLVGVSVGAERHKHALRLAGGPSEKQAAAKGLLEELVRRGVRMDRKYLFVSDGPRALGWAFDAAFGSGHPIQRCRHHTVENVMSCLPEQL